MGNEQQSWGKPLKDRTCRVHRKLRITQAQNAIFRITIFKTLKREKIRECFLRLQIQKHGRNNEEGLIALHACKKTIIGKKGTAA